MGRSTVSVGDLILYNPDGELDFLEDYAFDGRSLEVWVGPESGTYPTDFEQVLIGTMSEALVGGEDVVIKIKDLQEVFIRS